MTKKHFPYEIIVRALHTTQGDSLDVYSFFIRGADLVRIANISRVTRDENETLKGFQRPEIKSHVRGIVDYLNQGNVLFPNAIILSLSPEVKFAASRGTRPTGDEGIAQSGTLTIPIYNEGRRVAWIVDGQQRSLALSQTIHKDVTVPVVAFVSDNLETQREQFILVNKAKPLPTRLINELLPETRSVLLPRELSARRIPSEICGHLNRDPESPFYRLIKRPSDRNRESTAVITDTAVINMVKSSMNNPLGALSAFRTSRNGRDVIDIESMYQLLVTFWTSVKNVFHDAWGKDPRHSRLMHSAGIEAMGVLMDRIYARIQLKSELQVVTSELQKIAPECRWTYGVWDNLGIAWNEIENTHRDIRKLQIALVNIYSASGSER